MIHYYAYIVNKYSEKLNACFAQVYIQKVCWLYSRRSPRKGCGIRGRCCYVCPLPIFLAYKTWKWGKTRVVLVMPEAALRQATLYAALWRATALHARDRKYGTQRPVV